uniref:Uncharacterized protein n=1 Tax=Arundo donax TaxID=35708 RepID=A0A0A9HQE5_ARUDO
MCIRYFCQSILDRLVPSCFCVATCLLSPLIRYLNELDILLYH